MKYDLISSNYSFCIVVFIILKQKMTVHLQVRLQGTLLERKINHHFFDQKWGIAAI